MNENEQKIFSINKTIKLKENEENKKNQYFKNKIPIYSKKRIIERCYNCNEKGHIQKNCPNIKCYICNEKGHKSKHCPLNKNKINYINEIPKCKYCQNYGHYSNNCLINPEINFQINEPCYFCGNKKHLICSNDDNAFIISDYDSDDVIISCDEDDSDLNENYFGYIQNFKVNTDNFYSILNFFKNENQKLKNDKSKIFIKKNKKRKNIIFSDIKNEDISKTIFCYKCGERHSSKLCGIANKENDFMLKISQEGNYKVKNPLKYEPIAPKEEFIINHHYKNINYYNDTDSSGESYEKMYKDKNSENKN